MARHFRLRTAAAALGLTASALLAGSSPAHAAEPAPQPLLPPVQVTVPPVSVDLPVQLPDLAPVLGGDQRPPAGGTTATTTRPRPRTARPRPGPVLPPPPPPAAPATDRLGQPQARLSAAVRLPDEGPTAAMVTQQAARAARQFSLPLGMTSMIALFLGFQACLDRRDPKLAHAPLDDEVLGFS